MLTGWQRHDGQFPSPRGDEGQNTTPSTGASTRWRTAGFRPLAGMRVRTQYLSPLSYNAFGKFPSPRGDEGQNTPLTSVEECGTDSATHNSVWNQSLFSPDNNGKMAIKRRCCPPTSAHYTHQRLSPHSCWQFDISERCRPRHGICLKL